MEVKSLKNGNFSIIFPKSFTLAEVPVFTAMVMALEKRECKAIILDMKKLELIDSIGIKHLDNFITSIQRHGAVVSAINASSRVRSICTYKGLVVQFDDNLPS